MLSAVCIVSFFFEHFLSFLMVLVVHLMVVSGGIMVAIFCTIWVVSVCKLVGVRDGSPPPMMVKCPGFVFSIVVFKVSFGLKVFKVVYAVTIFIVEAGSLGVFSFTLNMVFPV